MGERQEEILKEIVENYIKNFKPVSSKSLVDKLNCSSATIRNDMADLEDLGYIEKEHTSSGRIPSEKGYKYYVNHLMQPKKMTGEDMLRLQTVLNNNSLVLSDAVTKCMEIISDITHYTSVVIDSNSNANLKKISIVPVAHNDDGTNDVVAILVTSQGDVENKQFKVEKNIDINELVKTSEIINKALVNTPLDRVNERLELEVKPLIRKAVTRYDEVCNFFASAFKDFAMDNTDVVFSGRTNLLDYKEYDNTDKMKEMVAKLNNEELVQHIETDDDNIRVYVGNESEFDSDVTIIKTHYKAGNSEGTLAIIGPKRMEYDKVVTLLNYVKEYLDK